MLDGNKCPPGDSGGHEFPHFMKPLWPMEADSRSFGLVQLLLWTLRNVRYFGVLSRWRNSLQWAACQTAWGPGELTMKGDKTFCFQLIDFVFVSLAVLAPNMDPGFLAAT